jgi:hypothetical protein
MLPPGDLVAELLEYAALTPGAVVADGTKLTMEDQDS